MRQLRELGANEREVRVRSSWPELQTIRVSGSLQAGAGAKALTEHIETHHGTGSCQSEGEEPFTNFAALQTPRSDHWAPNSWAQSPRRGRYSVCVGEGEEGSGGLLIKMPSTFIPSHNPQAKSYTPLGYRRLN